MRFQVRFCWPNESIPSARTSRSRAEGSRRASTATVVVLLQLQSATAVPCAAHNGRSCSIYHGANAGQATVASSAFCGIRDFFYGASRNFVVFSLFFCLIKISASPHAPCHHRNNPGALCRVESHLVWAATSAVPPLLLFFFSFSFSIIYYISPPFCNQRRERRWLQSGAVGDRGRPFL